MKQWIKDYLQLDKDIENGAYRKTVISKFILLSSFTILVVLMVGNFVSNNLTIFYADLILFIALISLMFFPGQQKQYIPHIAIQVMGLGILTVVFIDKAQGYTPIWAFLYIFLIMSLYGHKRGLIISLVFLTAMLMIMLSFMGSTITMMELIRFTMAASSTLLLAYLAEFFIDNTFKKLISATIQLEKLTKTDALTDLFNRRHLDECLPQQMSLIKRSDKVLGLAIVDIDHFKRYNDTFGHPAGDLAIVAVAKLLKSHMRRINDVVFRLGGEEFVLLYQTKDTDAALGVVEDIRRAIESLDRHCELKERITVSVGLLCIDAKTDLTVETAYELADKSLYLAKESGRNKVVLST